MESKTFRAYYIVLCAIIITLENIVDYMESGSTISVINLAVWIIVAIIYFILAISETKI